jgi:hypothetical protein
VSVQNVRMPWNLGVSLCKLGGHPKGLSLTAASTVAGFGAPGGDDHHHIRASRFRFPFPYSVWEAVLSAPSESAILLRHLFL